MDNLQKIAKTDTPEGKILRQVGEEALKLNSSSKSVDDWKKDFDEKFPDIHFVSPDGIENPPPPNEIIKSFITDLLQKKESAARKDERERCEKAVEKVNEKHKHLKKIHPVTSGGVEIACRSIVEAIRNRKDV